ncbi:MAG: YraN family protein [Candidatus Babeliales bacterium]
MHTRIQGDRGEDRVAQELERDGFTIIARNYAISTGEVDIIAYKGSLTIFVEVKTRTSYAQFDLSEVVSVAKQKKIMRAAKHWISRHSSVVSSYRFDVALIEHEEVTYIPDAFHVQDV